MILRIHSTRMDGPITRVMLHTLKPIIVKSEIEKIVNTNIESVKMDIFVKILKVSERFDPLPPTQYKIDIVNLYRRGGTIFGKLLTSEDRTKMIGLFLDRLYETFPDSKITLDPLETYVLVDWT